MISYLVIIHFWEKEKPDPFFAFIDGFGVA